MAEDTQHTAALLLPRRSSPPLLNPIILILLIPTLTLIIIFLLIPSFFPLTLNLVRPISVKKSWDTLNILLVLVAVLCGIFANQNGDGVSLNDENKSPPLDSDQRYEYSEMEPVTVGNRVRRNSSSYPDLRQVSEWETGYSQFKFFDDSELNISNRHNAKLREAAEIEVSDIKVILAPAKEAAEHESFRSLPRHRREKSENEIKKKWKRRPKITNIYDKMEKSPLPLSPPPPPPLPPSSFYDIFKKGKKNRRVYFIATQPPPPPPLPPPPMSHIFNKMFKTESKVKRFQNQYHASAPPPPPPPPPPRSIFNNMFKKGSKIKHFENKNCTSAPPPPPPPPPRSVLKNMFKKGGKNKKFGNQNSSSFKPPPPPPLSFVFNDLFKTNNKIKIKGSHYIAATPSLSPPPPPPWQRSTRGESMVIYIPAPPPLPPFRMPESGFMARGDFVRIQSAQSYMCSSPDLEDIDLLSDTMDGGDGFGREVTCPSPDVNKKADSFIAKLKGEWKLEKMNATKEKQLNPSASENL